MSRRTSACGAPTLPPCSGVLLKVRQAAKPTTLRGDSRPIPHLIVQPAAIIRPAWRLIIEAAQRRQPTRRLIIGGTPAAIPRVPLVALPALIPRVPLVAQVAAMPAARDARTGGRLPTLVKAAQRSGAGERAGREVTGVVTPRSARLASARGTH